ncbi:hypothetical protein SGLAU_33340 (plasmid) [Streptomyces glaucescens]|uniref:Uncharacterized protein n=1 Tax=Streptomyces glaucescens TaxID=1907 RepID=A0A089ZA31_STRGA|nr:hypothetical protein SGLAU_33340 [Streptomyces glaucescens]
MPCSALLGACAIPGAGGIDTHDRAYASLSLGRDETNDGRRITLSGCRPGLQTRLLPPPRRRRGPSATTEARIAEALTYLREVGGHHRGAGTELAARHNLADLEVATYCQRSPHPTQLTHNEDGPDRASIRGQARTEEHTGHASPPGAGRVRAVRMAPSIGGRWCASARSLFRCDGRSAASGAAEGLAAHGRPSPTTRPHAATPCLDRAPVPILALGKSDDQGIASVMYVQFPLTGFPLQRNCLLAQLAVRCGAPWGGRTGVSASVQRLRVSARVANRRAQWPSPHPGGLRPYRSISNCSTSVNSTSRPWARRPPSRKYISPRPSAAMARSCCSPAPTSWASKRRAA